MFFGNSFGTRGGGGGGGDKRVAAATLLVCLVLVLFVLRGFRMTDVEYCVSMLALLAALYLSATRDDTYMGRIGDTGRALFSREGFDSAAAIMQEILMPKIDQLVKSFHSSEKEGDHPPAEVKDAAINDARFANDPSVQPSMLETIKLQYKQLGFFFCNAKLVDSKKYAKLMSLLGAGSPEIEVSAETKAPEPATPPPQ